MSGPPRAVVRRARLWLTAAAVAGFLPAIGVPFRGWLDFAAFYAGGHFAGSGAIYDLGTVVRYQAANGMQVVPFVYPASVALLYAPLAALPYGLAAALHLLLMTGALVAAAIVWGEVVGMPRRWAVLGALAWGPAAASAVSGQNATLILLLVALAARMLVGRAGDRATADRHGAGEAHGAAHRIGSGLYAGLALAKPQLAAPAAAIVVARGGVTAVAGLGLALLAHYGLGVLAAGGDVAWPVAWLRAVSAYTKEDMLANGWQASSIPTLGARLSAILGSAIPSMIAWVVAIAVVVFCVRAFRGASVAASIAIACALGLVVSPHAWVYDATLLLPALSLLALEATRRGWPTRAIRAFVAAYALAILWPFGWVVGVTPVVLLVVAVALALVPDGAARRALALSDAAPPEAGRSR